MAKLIFCNIYNSNIYLTMPKKMFPGVAADSASTESSLSFAGFVSIQQDKKQSTRVKKEDLDFEFSHSIADKVIIPNYQQPSTATRHQASKQVPLESFLQIPTNKRESDKKQVNDQQSSSRKQVSQVKRKTYEKGSTVNKSFSQKLFSSFATPCRDCRSTQPTPSIKQHTLQ